MTKEQFEEAKILMYDIESLDTRIETLNSMLSTIFPVTICSPTKTVHIEYEDIIEAVIATAIRCLAKKRDALNAEFEAIGTVQEDKE